MKTLVLVESERPRKGITSRERRVYISSLDAQAHRMSDCVRGHWHIEQQVALGTRRNVRRRPDTHRQKKSGAENLASIRKIALNMLRRAPTPLKVESIVMRQRLANWRVDYLLAVSSSRSIQV